MQHIKEEDNSDHSSQDEGRSYNYKLRDKRQNRSVLRQKSDSNQNNNFNEFFTNPQFRSESNNSTLNNVLKDLNSDSRKKKEQEPMSQFSKPFSNSFNAPQSFNNNDMVSRSLQHNDSNSQSSPSFEFQKPNHPLDDSGEFAFQNHPPLPTPHQNKYEIIINKSNFSSGSQQTEPNQFPTGFDIPPNPNNVINKNLRLPRNPLLLSQHQPITQNQFSPNSNGSQPDFTQNQNNLLTDNSPIINKGQFQGLLYQQNDLNEKESFNNESLLENNQGNPFPSTIPSRKINSISTNSPTQQSVAQSQRKSSIFAEFDDNQSIRMSVMSGQSGIDQSDLRRSSNLCFSGFKSRQFENQIKKLQEIEENSTQRQLELYIESLERDKKQYIDNIQKRRDNTINFFRDVETPKTLLLPHSANSEEGIANQLIENEREETRENFYIQSVPDSIHIYSTTSSPQPLINRISDQNQSQKEAAPSSYNQQQQYQQVNVISLSVENLVQKLNDDFYKRRNNVLMTGKVDEKYDLSPQLPISLNNSIQNLNASLSAQEEKKFEQEIDELNSKIKYKNVENLKKILDHQQEELSNSEVELSNLAVQECEIQSGLNTPFFNQTTQVSPEKIKKLQSPMKKNTSSINSSNFKQDSFNPFYSKELSNNKENSFGTPKQTNKIVLQEDTQDLSENFVVRVQQQAAYFMNLSRENQKKFDEQIKQMENLLQFNREFNQNLKTNLKIVEKKVFNQSQETDKLNNSTQSIYKINREQDVLASEIESLEKKLKATIEQQKELCNQHGTQTKEKEKELNYRRERFLRFQTFQTRLLRIRVKQERLLQNFNFSKQQKLNFALKKELDGILKLKETQKNLQPSDQIVLYDHVFSPAKQDEIFITEKQIKLINSEIMALQAQIEEQNEIIVNNSLYVQKIVNKSQDKMKDISNIKGRIMLSNKLEEKVKNNLTIDKEINSLTEQLNTIMKKFLEYQKLPLN